MGFRISLSMEVERPILLGNGNGTFRPPLTLPCFYSFGGVAVGFLMAIDFKILRCSDLQAV